MDESSTEPSPASLESEIRRLKYELMQRQLDEKLITLKSYVERRAHAAPATNATLLNSTNATNSTDGSDDYGDVNEIFSSVLFANVIGDFEVWHFVLAILALWLLASMLRMLYFFILGKSDLVSAGCDTHN